MDRGIFKGSHKTFSGLILTLNANCLLPAGAIQQMLRFGYRRHPRQALIRVLAVRTVKVCQNGTIYIIRNKNTKVRIIYSYNLVKPLVK